MRSNRCEKRLCSPWLIISNSSGEDNYEQVRFVAKVGQRIPDFVMLLQALLKGFRR